MSLKFYCVQTCPVHAVRILKNVARTKNDLWEANREDKYRNFSESIRIFRMMHEKLGSKSAHSLYTFIKSEVKKMTKLKWKVVAVMVPKP